MVLIPYNEIAPDAPEFIRRYPAVVRNAVCSIRQINPNLFDTFASPFQEPFPVLNWRVQRDFWNTVCAPEPPPGRDLLITGGQCPTPYRWFVDWSSPSNQGTRQDPFLRTFPGPMSGVSLETPLTFPASGQRTLVFRFTDGSGVNHSFDVITGDANQIPFARAVRFERADGQPDTCGTVPVPVRAPIINTTFDVDVTVAGNNVSIPVTFGDITVVAGNVVTFRPVFNTPIGPIEFRVDGIEIGINPEINIGTGDDGGGGATISEIETVINNQTTTINNNGDTNTQTIINQAASNFDALEALIRCVCGYEGRILSTTTVVSNSFGGVFALPDNAYAVSIRANVPFTTNTPGQTGSGSAPRVYHWGWCSFALPDDEGGIRIPLQFEQQTLLVDRFAQSVLINPTYGNSFDLIAYTLEDCP